MLKCFLYDFNQIKKTTSLQNKRTILTKQQQHLNRTKIRFYPIKIIKKNEEKLMDIGSNAIYERCFLLMRRRR